MVVLAAGSFGARQLGSRPIGPLGDEILCRRGITDAVRCDDRSRAPFRGARSRQASGVGTALRAGEGGTGEPALESMSGNIRKRSIAIHGCLGLASLITFACLARGTQRLDQDGLTRETLKSGNREREFLICQPASLPDGEEVPVVFVYHGGTGTAKGTMNLTRFNALALSERFIAVYPQGIGNGWNDGRKTTVSESHRDGVDDLAFFDAMLKWLRDHRPIDRRRIFVTGISNGGIFAHYLAAQRSGQIAAIAPVVGGIARPFDKVFQPAEPVSVLIVQGTDDPLVLYEGGAIGGWDGKDRGAIISTDAACRLWVTANGCFEQSSVAPLPDRDPNDGCRVEATKWSQGQANSEVWLYRVQGGGHTWPGGIQYAPKRLIGRVTHDIDSDEIWRFFESHPKPK